MTCSSNKHASFELPNNYTPHKLPAFHPHGNKNDLFITSSSHINAACKRAIKLFDSGFTSVSINGLGNAIYKAVETANLIIDSFHLPLKTKIETGSTEVYNELLPKTDDLLPIVTSKSRSFIHLTLTKV
ncbi:hypothetical protein P9112_007575 [Eukaryota sp. TZLM1-RC]